MVFTKVSANILQTMESRDQTRQTVSLFGKYVYVRGFQMGKIKV